MLFLRLSATTMDQLLHWEIVAGKCLNSNIVLSTSFLGGGQKSSDPKSANRLRLSAIFFIGLQTA